MGIFTNYLAAKILRDKEAAKAAKAVVELHDFIGHMPSSLREVRDSVQKTTMSRLAKEWDHEEMRYFRELTGLK